MTTQLTLQVLNNLKVELEDLISNADFTLPEASELYSPDEMSRLIISTRNLSATSFSLQARIRSASSVIKASTLELDRDQRSAYLTALQSPQVRSKPSLSERQGAAEVIAASQFSLRRDELVELSNEVSFLTETIELFVKELDSTRRDLNNLTYLITSSLRTETH